MPFLLVQSLCPLTTKRGTDEEGVKLARERKMDMARVLLREMEINFSECDCGSPRMRSPRDDGLQHLEQQNFTCSTFLLAFLSALLHAKRALPFDTTEPRSLRFGT